MSAVLIAIGGNALVLDGEPGSIERQLERAASFADTVAELVADGWTVVVTHGNGPQVGFILRRGELVAPDASVEGLPNLPLWLAVADSQGGIGHMLAVALDTALERAGLASRAVAVLCSLDGAGALQAAGAWRRRRRWWWWHLALQPQASLHLHTYQLVGSMHATSNQWCTSSPAPPASVMPSA